jgi:hypothetical protein
MEHKHTPDEERRIRDATLDKTIADTFPASDAPSTVPNPDDDEAIGKDLLAPGLSEGGDAEEKAC